MDAIIQTLEGIVGRDGVVSWEQLSDRQRSPLTHALLPPVSLVALVYPHTQAELSDVIRCAHQHNWRVLPCGQGSKLHWGGLAKGIQIAVSTARMNQLIDHAVGDLTITAEAGMTFATAQGILRQANQRLGLAPSFANRATLGGILATADTGSLRQRYGGVRDMVLGLSLVRADGELVKAGGRVVKNVAGYDLMKLFTGSFGTLGIVSQITLRVYPQAEASRTGVLVGDAAAIAQAATTLLSSALTPVAVDLLSPQLVNGLELGQGMGLVVKFESLAASVMQQCDRLFELGNALGLTGHSLTETLEDSLWDRLEKRMTASALSNDSGLNSDASFPQPGTIESSAEESSAEESSDDSPVVLCKLGVRSTEAVNLLTQLDTLLPTPWQAQMHMGSGLGRLRLDLPNRMATDQLVAALEQVRSRCQQAAGFLTVLQAPIALKQKIDVWGYAGNALTIQRRLKQQFDPQHLLSPQRFISGL